MENFPESGVIKNLPQEEMKLVIRFLRQLGYKWLDDGYIEGCKQLVWYDEIGGRYKHMRNTEYDTMNKEITFSEFLILSKTPVIFLTNF